MILNFTQEKTLKIMDMEIKSLAPITGAPKKRAMPAALWALTICAFAIGTTEFVTVGLVPTLAKDLKVSVAAAGNLVSVYAMGVAIGAPVLTALTAHIKRKKLMIALMVLFIAGHIASFIAPTYEFLFISRFVTGFAHGVFFGVGATIASALVRPDKRATAISLMFSGLTIATIIGAPLGTYIGQHWTWRFTFTGVAVLGVIGLVAVAMLLPGNIERASSVSLIQQLKILRSKRLTRVLLMTILCYAGVFVAFTYLSPILQQITGVSENTVSFLLLVYGVAVAVGNVVGGKLADKNPLRATVQIFMCLVIVLTAFYFTDRYTIPAIITLFLLGGLSFATVPALQLYIVQIAEREIPEATDFASALNIACFNLGIALGAWAGGLIALSGFGVALTPLAGAAFALVALVLALISKRIDKNSNQQ